MPVQYDASRGKFVVVDPIHCEQPMYDTGCDAPGCTGFWCQECGAGCDMEFDDVDGFCAQALADESEEERDLRYNRERAAFGLPPM